MTERIFHRIVLTGAAGRLGTMLRPMLRGLTETLVLSDLHQPTESLVDGECFIACDLADHAAMYELLAGAELVAHFGGLAQENAMQAILNANIIGQFNLYDAALRQGVRRIVLASSNHVTGFYPVGQKVTPDMPMRPDSLYGVSKCCGEMLASYYHTRHGIESVCLRIGNCNDQPRTLRALTCWLSPDDLRALVRCAATAPAAGYAVVYGVSDNTGVWWESPDAGRLGFQPRDSSERFRAEICACPEAAATPPPLWQGGGGASSNPDNDYRCYGSGVASTQPRSVAVSTTRETMP